jgi:hypothetical protein
MSKQTAPKSRLLTPLSVKATVFGKPKKNNTAAYNAIHNTQQTANMILNLFTENGEINSSCFFDDLLGGRLAKKVYAVCMN